MKLFLAGCILAALPTCLGAEPNPAAPQDLVVWSVNEYVQSTRDVDLAAQVPSQLLIRGWFKWANVSSVSKHLALLPKVHANRQLFGGGITLSALYRGENGIDETTFLDFATRDPKGNLYPAFGRANYYHGTLSNPRYVDYCLKWAFEQIDAGVDHLFMDEVDAAHGEQEGYDDYATREFRAWLQARHKDWSASDSRWKAECQIPLEDKKVCPDGTMKSFAYRAFLEHHQAAAHPWGEKNPLAGPWLQFKFERDDRVWKEICGRLHDYGRAKGRTVLIAANGLNRYVDHQIQNLWDKHLFLDKEKRVNPTPSLLPWGGDLVQKSRALLGRDVPIVVFHDWGFGMPWQNIPVEDRNLWLKVYAPELYAAGVCFAFPVHGPFGCDSEKDGTLPTIIQEAGFFRKHADCFRVGSRIPLAAEGAQVKAEHVSIKFEEQPVLHQRLVHLINHHFTARRVNKISELELSVLSPAPPKAVRIVSPDFEGPQTPAWEFKAGRIVLRIPSLEYYDLVVLRYDKMAALSAARTDRDVVIIPRGYWHKAPVSRFEVSATGAVTDLHWINSYLQGKLHAPLRDSPKFVAFYAQDGSFDVAVNSVATLGARLEIYVDEKLALQENLNDQDKKNDGFGNEIHRTFSVPVSRGAHVIRVANTGGDWLTLDRYILRNALNP